MLDINITNLEAGKTALETLKKSSNALEESKANTDFSALSKIGCSDTFNNQITNSIKEIKEFLDTKIVPASDIYFADDNEIEEIKIPSVKVSSISLSTSGSGQDGISQVGKGRSVSGGSYGGGDVATPVEVAPHETGQTLEEVVIPAVEIPEVPDPVDDVPVVDLENIDKSSLNKLSLDELFALINEIDKNKDENIKKILLESPYIPEEFKKIIAELDLKTVEELYQELLKNNYEMFSVNSLNVGITYSYLKEKAEENDISVEDLINNKEYADKFDKLLKEMDDVIELFKGWEKLPPQEFQDQLRDFYFGDVPNDFPDRDIETTRSFVDYLADECDVYYGDLLSDKSYAEVLKEGAVEYGKSLVYLKANSGSESTRSNITKLFNGTDYKVYGMTDKDLTSFQTEISSLASKNNVSSEELLRNSKYSEEIKEIVNNNSVTSDIGAIYKNEDSTVLQKVVKNLYDTKIESENK